MSLSRIGFLDYLQKTATSEQQTFWMMDSNTQLYNPFKKHIFKGNMQYAFLEAHKLFPGLVFIPNDNYIKEICKINQFDLIDLDNCYEEVPHIICDVRADNDSYMLRQLIVH